jgi:hypothetical protein
VSSKKKSSRVYVIGAGFSAGLGFPMTNDLLLKVWGRLDPDLRKRLTRIIKFHHPEFNPKRRTSFPELEPLLSAMEANRELFNHTRKVTGNFRPKDIIKTSNGLLWHVAQWFDEIHQGARADTGAQAWLSKFARHVKKENSAIISFNWDLVLDELLLDPGTIDDQYGFGAEPDAPMLLKPHGSLNWFSEAQAAFIKDEKVVKLAGSSSKGTWAFTEFRAPRSKKGRKYDPLIVPPHYMKRFNQPGFQNVWNACVTKLSTASEVVFIGYSQPPSDFHARFMLRCAFHNTVDGLIVAPNKRGKPAGPPAVTVVNPDQTSALRIEAATTPAASFEWIPSTARAWIESDEFP